AEKLLVAGNKELSLSNFGERKKVIVVGIGRKIERRQLFHDDGHVAEPVDKPSGERWKEAGTDLGVARHARDFFDLLGGSEDGYSAVAPKREYLGGRGRWRHHGRQEDVGVKHEP